MEFVVNGESRTANEGATVSTLLADLGVPEERVVVELNGAILPRARFSGEKLADGDRLEVVRFVGGG